MLASRVFLPHGDDSNRAFSSWLMSLSSSGVSWPSSGPRSAAVCVGIDLVAICFLEYFNQSIFLMVLSIDGSSCGGQLMLRTCHIKVLRRRTQNNFSGVRVNQSEHFRADGAEPVVNNIMKVVGGTKENGQFRVGQVEAEELAADVIIEAGAASRVGTLRNHPALFPPQITGPATFTTRRPMAVLRLPVL